MDFNQAAKLMGEGKAVQSFMSHTTYEMSSEGLLAEGLHVPDEHLTMDEANGEWREVQVIETLEELQTLSADQKEQLLNDAMKHFIFNRQRAMKELRAVAIGPDRTEIVVGYGTNEELATWYQAGRNITDKEWIDYKVSDFPLDKQLEWEDVGNMTLRQLVADEQFPCIAGYED